MPPEVRFWRHVSIVDASRCHEWTGCVDAWGYGRFTTGYHVSVIAHRFAWQMANGRPVPSGMMVLHHCDNPRCVNADHLFLGTNSDNQLDAARKGRHAETKRTHCAKGHPFAGTNLRLLGNGTRQCVECRRASAARTTERLRAAR